MEWLISIRVLRFDVFPQNLIFITLQGLKRITFINPNIFLRVL